MNTLLVLSAYRPVHLLVVALAVLVLAVIAGQVLTLGRRNRSTSRARKSRPGHHRDAVEPSDSDPGDGDPWGSANRDSGPGHADSWDLASLAWGGPR